MATQFSRGYDNSSAYAGLYSGQSAADQDESLITVANPASGIYSLQIGDPNTPANLANGSYTVVIEELLPSELNLDASLNTNGNSNGVGGLLVDNQRAFYRVEVPELLDGQPLLGWYLTTAVSQGAAQIRVRKDLLPTDASNAFPDSF